MFACVDITLELDSEIKQCFEVREVSCKKENRCVLTFLLRMHISSVSGMFCFSCKKTNKTDRKSVV